MPRETAAERAAREALEPPEDWDDQTVITALIRVMRDLRAVGKDSQNTESPDQFFFRGIDAMVNAAGPLLRKHGVLCLPKTLKADLRTVTTRQGEATYAWVQVRYRFVGPAGDRITVTVPGEAMDVGDKALSKAMSVAWRIALIQALAVPTGERDPDASSYQQTPGAAGTAADRRDRASAEQRQRGATDPRQEWWDAIGRKADELGLSRNDVRRNFARWSGGKQIDGRDVTVELLVRYHEEVVANGFRDDQPAVPASAPTQAELDQEATAAAMLHDQLGGVPVDQQPGDA